MFLGLPDPDPLVRGMDPDPDPELKIRGVSEKFKNQTALIKAKICQFRLKE